MLEVSVAVLAGILALADLEERTVILLTGGGAHAAVAAAEQATVTRRASPASIRHEPHVASVWPHTGRRRCLVRTAG